MEEKVSVCIPVYNGASTILETIRSILKQTFADFELVVIDNASTDNTLEVIKMVKDERIKIYRNEKNIGCGGNLEECKKRATGDILFYISADDVADINAIRKVYDAFKISEDIGIVTRPYYWFDEGVSKPVRATRQFSGNQIVSINDSYEKIRDVIALSDQISGVAFRKKYMDFLFGQKPFVETASIIVPMLKTRKAVILKENIVAIRINKSGALNPVAYEKSPMLAWYNLITTTYCEEKFRSLKRYLIHNLVANNYIGLVQIKNFGSYKALFREIYYLIKLRWRNIFNLKFWLFSIGTIIIPRLILRKLVVIYKNKINSKFFKNIKINIGGR